MNGEGDPLVVAATHPSLPGHFPGRPVVPGVLIIDLLIEEWRRAAPNAPVRGLGKMKFVSPLAPGQRFQVTWAAIRNGKVSFKAHIGDLTLATGQFVLD